MKRMHSSTVALTVLLCTGLIAIQCSRATTKNQQDHEGAFSEAKNKRTGKLPRMSFDFGLFGVDSFFGNQKLEDRLRLSKAYIKHEVRSKLLPFEDPLYVVKHSLVEELINCENLTTLVRPASWASSIDCRPLEAHSVDPNYVSPVSDLSITQYVRRSSFRVKRSTILNKRARLINMLIYPLRRDAIDKYIGNYVTENKLGDAKSVIKSYINRGYYIHMDFAPHFALQESPAITCSGNVYLSINSSSGFYVRESNDPYPEYIDEINFLYDEAYKGGYLLSLHDIKCGLPDAMEMLEATLDFTIAQQQEFPYLFVRHSFITEPYELLLNYKSSVDQVRNSVATGNPDSYNTTVFIRSSSVVIDFMNFILNQTISNDDFKNGFEKVNFINLKLPITVSAKWNNDYFMKRFSFLTTKYLGIAEGLQYIMNATYINHEKDDEIMLVLEIKKMLFQNLGSKLNDALGPDKKFQPHDYTPEDEQSLREEL